MAEDLPVVENDTLEQVFVENIKSNTAVSENLEQFMEILDKEKESSEKEQKILEKQEKEQAILDQKKEEQEHDFRQEILQEISQPTELEGDQYELLIQKLDVLIEQNATIKESDHLISIYGYIVVPAAIITYLLWKMIKAFI